MTHIPIMKRQFALNRQTESIRRPLLGCAVAGMEICPVILIIQAEAE